MLLGFRRRTSLLCGASTASAERCERYGEIIHRGQHRARSLSARVTRSQTCLYRSNERHDVDREQFHLERSAPRAV